MEYTVKYITKYLKKTLDNITYKLYNNITIGENIMNDSNYEFLQKILYPLEYKTDYIKTYYKFNSELKNIIEKSGYKKQFTVKYFKSLKFLISLKRNCIQQSKLFEKLINVDYDLYSIKLHGKNKNIRIIFIFMEVEGEEIVLLLNSFEEKAKKDYYNSISIAYERIKSIK